MSLPATAAMRTPTHDRNAGVTGSGAPSIEAALRKSPASQSARGFTLIELVLVLTLLALITAAAVPSIKGLQEETLAREPLNDLAKLAKQTRLRAMKEKRPYQIVFTTTGFTATRYLSPYLQAAELEEFLQKTEIEARQKAEAGLTAKNGDPAAEAGQATAGSSFAGAPTSAGGAAPPAAPAFQEWTEKHDLPEGMTYSVQFWYEPEPVPMEGTAVKLWVFQPTGLVSPLTVKMSYSAGAITASFSALTADIVKETNE